MATKLVDPHSYDLADWWLAGGTGDTIKNAVAHKALVMSLAQSIQKAIEDWQDEQAQEEADKQAQLAEGAGYTAEERSRI